MNELDRLLLQRAYDLKRNVDPKIIADAEKQGLKQGFIDPLSGGLIKNSLKGLHQVGKELTPQGLYRMLRTTN